MDRQELLNDLCLMDKHIMECHAMIDHFIRLGNTEEIAYWRRVLQIAKNDKRKMKNKLEGAMAV